MAHVRLLPRRLLKDAPERARSSSSPPSTCSRTCPTSSTPDVDPVRVDRRARWTRSTSSIGVIGLSPNGIRGQAASTRAASSSSGRPTRTRAWTRSARWSRRRPSTTSSSAIGVPVGHVPAGRRSNDKKMYPIYMKCVELDIPICINGGIVGPRMPSWPQHVEHFDEVCYDFPELTHGDDARRRAVDGAGREADAQVARPALHDQRLRPEALPEGHHQLRQHPRRRQDHVLRLLPGRPDARAAVPRHAERAVQRRACGRSSSARTPSASSSSTPWPDGCDRPRVC